MTDRGHCKHGEFNLLGGCPQCINERLAEELKAKLAREDNIKPALVRQIVKVRYFSETTGEISPREYTYYSAEPLKVGDIVIVPVRNSTGKAKVSAIDVPVAEIANFKDKVKTIPPGSVTVDNPHTTEELSQVEIEAIAKDIEERRARGIRPEQDEMEDGLNAEGLTLTGDESETTYTVAVRIKPETDIQVNQFYAEALKAREYAEARVITTVDDLKPATDDLSLIARLKKAMEDKRKEYVKPLNDHVKTINDAFKTLMEPIETADSITRGKILAFQLKQKLIREEQEKINTLRLEAAKKEMELKGEISESVNLVEVIPEAPRRVSTDTGSIGQRDHWTFEVLDITLVPAEYLILDSAKVGKVVRAGLRTIPGIRIYNEPILAVNIRA